MTDPAFTSIPHNSEIRPTLMQERLDVLPLETEAEQLPVTFRELIALFLIIVVCDVTIYRGRGDAGFGLLFSVAPLLLFLGMVRRTFDPSSWILAPLLALLSIRLIWCGSHAAIVAGFVILCGYAMGLSGLRPHVLQAVVFAAHLISAGHRGLHLYSRSLARFSPKILQAHLFAVLLPVATLIVFSAVFLLANPDLVKSFHSGMTWLVDTLEVWLSHFHASEILFCFGIGWITVGLLRPEVNQVAATDAVVTVTPEKTTAPLYEAIRNTLVMVIGLFAIYLVFEFQTLWFRVFPQGFHYSGYAHEGAAWLTVALGLATLLLSMMFRGQTIQDPRLPRLRLLAWVWSAENLLLAMAVFNRLFIYVGFNGMTQMRVIGLLGVSSVVVGFLLVLIKIARNHDFVWLVRRQLWTVAIAGYLYAVLPVDGFVNEFNVRRIMAGDPAPCVQISVHPTSAEGYLRLAPLIHCEDEMIRRGIRAMLAEKLAAAEVAAVNRTQAGWTAIQLAEDQLLEQLRAVSTQWESDEDVAIRAATLKEFHTYAYQWY